MKIIRTLIATVLLMLGSQPLLAASVDVTFGNVPASVDPGQTFTVDILGSYTGLDALIGGALDLQFSKSQLKVTSVAVNTTVFEFSSTPGTIDNSAGAVSEIGFASFQGATGKFRIATVSFEALAGGLASLTMSDALSNIYPWTDFDSALSGTPITTQFGSAQLQVVGPAPVPLPLPAALLGSALAVLGFRGRQRSDLAVNNS
jgi:hypothetical protein